MVEQLERLLELHFGLVRAELESQKTFNSQAWADRDKLDAQAERGARTRKKNFRAALVELVEASAASQEEMERLCVFVKTWEPADG